MYAQNIKKSNQRPIMCQLRIYNIEYVHQRYFSIQNMEDNDILQDDINSSQGDEISQADSTGSQSTMDVSSNFSGNGSTIFEMQDYISNANSSVGEEQEEQEEEEAERREIRNFRGNIDIDCEVLIFATIQKVLET